MLAFWDSLVWASAKLNQIPFVLTEDAEHGQFLAGVRVMNPFDARFDVDVLG